MAVSQSSIFHYGFIQPALLPWEYACGVNRNLHLWPPADYKLSTNVVEPFNAKKSSTVSYGQYFSKIMPESFFSSTINNDANRNIVIRMVNKAAEEDADAVRDLLAELHKQRKRMDPVCWPHSWIAFVAQYDTNVAGLHQSVLDVDSIRKGFSAMPLKPYPSARLGSPISACLNKDDRHREEIAALLNWQLAALTIDIEEPEPDSSKELQAALHGYALPFVQAIAEASRDEYRCRYANGCGPVLNFGQPTRPWGFEDFIKSLTLAIKSGNSICITEALPKLRPDTLYIVF